MKGKLYLLIPSVFLSLCFLGNAYSATASKKDQTRMLPPLELKNEGKSKIEFKTKRMEVQKKQTEKAVTVSSEKYEWLIVPKELEDMYNFWLNIYTKYTNDEAVIHDPKNLGIIYGIVDLKDIIMDSALSDGQKEIKKQDRIDAAKELVKKSLLRLAENPKTDDLNDDERRLRFLFNRIEGKNKFEDAATDSRLRAQIGMRDKFIEAIKISGKYFPDIESIFRGYNLPIELTRLIFVESMFNINAVSSAEAKGLWQFLKSTGKLYLRINSNVDERLDPFLSTHAAAKLLLDNYEYLGSWPLAINAYNAGKGRMRQAVSTVGSTNIAKIIKKFEHPSYGFASKNFFMEFLAANEAYRNREKYFGQIEITSKLDYQDITLQFNISLPKVLKLSSITEEEFRKLNPGMSNDLMSGVETVPAGFQLRLPRGKASIFEAIAARAPLSYLGDLKYIVNEGDTLESIANEFNVLPDEILKRNNLEEENLVVGLEIRIPAKEE